MYRIPLINIKWKNKREEEGCEYYLLGFYNFWCPFHQAQIPKRENTGNWRYSKAVFPEFWSFTWHLVISALPTMWLFIKFLHIISPFTFRLPVWSSLKSKNPVLFPRLKRTLRIYALKAKQTYFIPQTLLSASLRLVVSLFKRWVNERC